MQQAKNKLKQPNTADRPILAAPQPSRAGLEQPQFWSDFSEILDLTRIVRDWQIWLPQKNLSVIVFMSSRIGLMPEMRNVQELGP